MTFKSYTDACDYYEQYQPGSVTNRTHGGQRKNPNALRQFVDHKIATNEIVVEGFIPPPIKGHHYHETSDYETRIIDWTA